MLIYLKTLCKNTAMCLCCHGFLLLDCLLSVCELHHKLKYILMTYSLYFTFMALKAMVDFFVFLRN